MNHTPFNQLGGLGKARQLFAEQGESDRATGATLQQFHPLTAAFVIQHFPASSYHANHLGMK